MPVCMGCYKTLLPILFWGFESLGMSKAIHHTCWLVDWLCVCVCVSERLPTSSVRLNFFQTCLGKMEGKERPWNTPRNVGPICWQRSERRLLAPTGCETRRHRPFACCKIADQNNWQQRKINSRYWVFFRAKDFRGWENELISAITVVPTKSRTWTCTGIGLRVRGHDTSHHTWKEIFKLCFPFSFHYSCYVLSVRVIFMTSLGFYDLNECPNVIWYVKCALDSFVSFRKRKTGNKFFYGKMHLVITTNAPPT